MRGRARASMDSPNSARQTGNTSRTRRRMNSSEQPLRHAPETYQGIEQERELLNDDKRNPVRTPRDGAIGSADVQGRCVRSDRLYGGETPPPLRRKTGRATPSAKDGLSPPSNPRAP